jgi:hypothetical protein
MTWPTKWYLNFKWKHSGLNLEQVAHLMQKVVMLLKATIMQASMTPATSGLCGQ